MASPLHQFEIHPIVPFQVGGWNLAFTNSALFMVLTVLVASVLMIAPMRGSRLIPTRWQSIPEMLYEFIAGVIRDVIGTAGLKYLPFVFTLFMIVFIGNMLGMMPYGFTITSHIIVTAALGVLVISIVTIMGIVNHGWHFLSLFAPSGLPKIMYLLLVPIEVIRSCRVPSHWRFVCAPT
jgi:F-type H+-transporting ATPase subunit a